MPTTLPQTTTEASWRRLADGTWGIRVHDASSLNAGGREGHTIIVTRRDGSTSDVTLGNCLGTRDGNREATYRVAPASDRVVRPVADETTPDLTPGVYEVDGVAYVVKPNRRRTGMYAKRIVEIGGTRSTDAGIFVAVEFEYERGAINRIRPEHRMPYEWARELTIRYGRCICCGRSLRAGESVEQGIGPVCVRQFPEAARQRRVIQQIARAEASGNSSRAAALREGLREGLGRPTPEAREAAERLVYEPTPRSQTPSVARPVFEDEADEQAWMEKQGVAA